MEFGVKRPFTNDRYREGEVTLTREAYELYRDAYLAQTGGGSDSGGEDDGNTPPTVNVIVQKSPTACYVSNRDIVSSARPYDCYPWRWRVRIKLTDAQRRLEEPLDFTEAFKKLGLERNGEEASAEVHNLFACVDSDGYMRPLKKDVDYNYRNKEILISRELFPNDYGFYLPHTITFVFTSNYPKISKTVYLNDDGKLKFINEVLPFRELALPEAWFTKGTIGASEFFERFEYDWITRKMIWKDGHSFKMALYIYRYQRRFTVKDYEGYDKFNLPRKRWRRVSREVFSQMQKGRFSRDTESLQPAFMMLRTENTYYDGKKLCIYLWRRLDNENIIVLGHEWI